MTTLAYPEYRIVPRIEMGLPAIVRSSGGSPRPPLRNEPIITAHYTGNNVDYTGRPTAEVTRQIQRVFEDSKPFEYNYVIGQDDDNEIGEFAGKFQAAHSGGENSIAFGVLFLLGIGEDPTPLMIDKWRWLRDVLIFDGALHPTPEQLMHFQMPDAATRCPGNIRNFWPQFLPKWTPPVTTPLPAPIPVPPKKKEVLTMKPFIWQPAGYLNQFLIGAGPALHLSPGMAAELKDTKIIVETDPHAQSLTSVCHQAGILPIVADGHLVAA